MRASSINSARFLAFSSVATAILSFTPRDVAARTWVAGDGNWNVAGNWSPAGVPTANDVVTISETDGVSRTVTYDYPTALTLNDLTLDLTNYTAPDTTTLYMPAGSLTIAAAESVGNSGSGTFSLVGGINTVNSGATLTLGTNIGAVGAYNLGGTGTLSAAGREYVGYFGIGTMTQYGGTNSVASTGALHIGYAASATGEYDLGAGLLSVGAAEYVGESGFGTFDQTGGAHTVLNTANANVFIGYNAGSSGTYYLSGGAHSISGTNALYLGYSTSSTGTYNLSGTGSFSATGGEFIGNSGNGTFEQSGGANSFGNFGLNVGNNAGSVGIYNLDGGSLSATNTDEDIGALGNGTFNQTAGTNTLSGSSDLFVAYAAPATGAYNLSGGLSSIAGNVTVGGGLPGPGGTGTLTVSNTGILTVGGTLQVFSSVGSGIDFNGGTINAHAMNFNGNSALFNWTGGTLNITTSVTWDSSAAPTSTAAAFGPSLTLQAGQSLGITGDETIGGSGVFALELGAGSSHIVSGTITLPSTGTLTLDAGSSLSYTALTQVGGTLNGTLQNIGAYNYSGGQFNGSLINQGTASFQADFAASTSENDGTVTIVGNHTITFNDGGLDNFGAVTLTAQQTLAGTQVINDVGGIINSAGSISAPLSNFGTLYTSATTGLIAITGAMTNYGFVGPVATGVSFRPSGGLDNFGTVQLNGGSLSGTGAVINDFGGLIQSGVGASSGIVNSGVSAPLINSGGVIVAGSNTILNLSNFGGNNSGGQLIVQNNATLNATFAFENNGVIALQGSNSALSGGTISNTGTITGSGRVSNSVSNTGVVHGVGGTLTLAGSGDTNPATAGPSPAGQIQVDSGSSIVFSQGLTTNGGSISLIGGTFDNNGKPLANTGVINGFGTIRTGGLSSTGALNVGGGDMSLFGNATNNGSIHIDAARNLYFFNNVDGAGAYTGTGTAIYLASFSPGNSPASVSFGGSVDLTSSAALTIELGGTSIGSQFDNVNVAGQLTLGGALQVILINGFAPAAGNSFNILDWGRLTSTFSSISLPTLSGDLIWNTSQLYTTGELSVVTPGIPGDYNNNGIVDAADYVVWRANQGTNNALDNDPIGGTIGTAQFNQWRSQFGQSAGSGSGASSNASVPEPASALLLLIFGAAAGIRRGSRVAPRVPSTHCA